MRNMLAICGALALVFLLALPVLAHEGPHPSASPSPAGAPIGESNLVVALAAAAGIVVVGAAGIYIYRLIKKGL